MSLPTVIRAVSYAVAITLGSLTWYDNCRIYWHKDLPAPLGRVWILLIVCGVAVAELVIIRVGLAQLSLSTFSKPYLSTALALAVFIPLLSFSVSGADSLLGGELPKIYFFSNDGPWILLGDSIILALLGFAVGLLVAGAATILAKLSVSNDYQPSTQN